MAPDRLHQKLTTLRAELQKADEELGKLRPRVQYLEAVCYRLDGAITALQELQDPGPLAVNSQAPAPQGA